MAKCLGAVADPQRIPQREYPYAASDQLLLGGMFRPVKAGLTPVHTLITAAGDQEAALSYAVFSTAPHAGALLAASGAQWDRAPAHRAETAPKPSQRPLEWLLEPPSRTPDRRF